MADQTAVPVNGNYMPHQTQPYGIAEQPYPAHAAANSTSPAAEYNGPAAQAATSAGGASDLPKDEVGWYFVEQYYTTMSRSPEKLFLFYNKRSQFVSGTEAEKAPVSVGQRAINDRIRELDIQDCKVRVTNVDSQGSGQNIVIQVIGEISNKAAPQRKFTQTFVLAEQTNGYFVLNDIFRYIVDEEEEIEGDELQKAQIEAESGYQEPPGILEENVPETLTSSGDPIQQDRDVAMVDQGLEEAIQNEPSLAADEPASINGAQALEAPELIPAETVPVGTTDLIDAPTEPAEAAVESVQAEDLVVPEQPQDPLPSPSRSPAKSVEAIAEPPPAPPKPAAPKTWAELAAGNRAQTAASMAAAAASTTSSAPKAAPVPSPRSLSTAPTPVNTTSVPAPSTDVDQITPQSSGSEWQMAGHNHGRQSQSRPQQAATPAENSRAYIKNVGESIDDAALRGALEKVAKINYFDINRQKNCAFVDFASPADFQAAVAANPHDVSGERIYVEERRVRAQNMPYNNNRGRGRGGVPRGDSTRGTFSNRGRGNNVNTRGRGAPQPS